MSWKNPPDIVFSPFTQPLPEWAKAVGVTEPYACTLARHNRIKAPKGTLPKESPGAKKIAGEWYVVPGSYYDYKPLGGARPGAGRKPGKSQS